MKKIFFYSLLIPVAAISFYSCKEICPGVDFTPVDETLLDTTYVTSTIPTAQKKAVLIEDYTGVACTNCPTSHAAIEAIISSHPDDTICVAGIHNYGVPALPGSTEDYEYDENNQEKIGFDVYDFLGGVNAWPTGIIDRKDFGEPLGIYDLSPATYATYVDQDLTLTPPCNISVEEVSLDENHVLTIKVTVIYTQEVDTVNHLTIYLTESGLINPQQSDPDVIEDYVHNFVLRDALTPVAGVPLDDALTPGRVFEKEFKYTVDPSWVPGNIEIIAFVGNFVPADANYVVLQSAKLHGI